MINKIFLCIALANLSTTSMPMSKIGLTTACQQAEHLIETSEIVDIDAFIFTALIWHESRWLASSVSKAKACGLTQILAKYSEYTCNDLKDPSTSITEGASILFSWQEKKKDIRTSLKCYNSGYACSSSSYANIIINKSKILKSEYLKVQEKLIGDENE